MSWFGLHATVSLGSTKAQALAIVALSPQKEGTGRQNKSKSSANQNRLDSLHLVKIDLVQAYFKVKTDRSVAGHR